MAMVYSCPRVILLTVILSSNLITTEEETAHCGLFSSPSTLMTVINGSFKNVMISYSSCTQKR